MCVALGDREDEAWSLVGLAALVERRGEPERAALLLGAADRLLGNMGASFKPYEHRLHERVSTALHQTLGAETLARLLAEGSALDDTSLVTQAAGADRPG